MSRSKKRVRILPLIAVIIVAAALVYSGLALSRPVPALAAKTISVTPQLNAKDTSLPWPKYGQAAIGAMGYGVIETHGQQKPLATASLAKIMTALAVLHKHPLKLGQQGPTITITREDEAIYDYYYVHDGSLAAQKVGERITEYQALEAMLLPSANNFADILADWAYGSLEEYSAYANNYAKTIGMTDSHFVDGSGFSGQTTSTANDLVKLAIVAMKNPVIAHIVGEKKAKIPVAGTIYNVNWLLGKHDIIGMKTGNNDQDHGAYIAATRFKVDGKIITMISVVMGAPHLPNALLDSVPLINKARDNFHEATIINKGQIVGYYNAPWGSQAEAVTASGLKSTIIWGNHYPQITISLEPLHTPAEKGTVVGKVSFDSPGLIPIPVKLKDNLAAAPWDWRLTHF